MKLVWIIFLAFFASSPTAAQKVQFNVGIEQDVLPYLTRGYFLGGWIGKNKLRTRVLTAHVQKPAWITPDGFVDNQVTAYAFLLDYFLKDDWIGWWLGGGIVYWDSSIQRAIGGNTTFYENWMLNGSMGYQWKFCKHFYVSPWAGLHIRIGGAKKVEVDGDAFNTSLFNPEASIKVGWYF